MKIIPIVALGASAGLAFANPFQQNGLPDLIFTDPAGIPTDNTMQIDISGYESIELLGSVLNQSLSVFVGAGAVITGIGWDVTLTTFGESWASESAMSFEGQINVTPGFADGFGVTDANYSSGGIADLSDQGLPNIVVGADGYLDIEFFELFVDLPGEPDAQWQSGSIITIAGSVIPVPGTLPVLGAGALIATRRRRFN